MITMLLCGVGATAQKYSLKTDYKTFRNLDSDGVIEIVDCMYAQRDSLNCDFVLYWLPGAVRRYQIMIVVDPQDGTYKAIDLDLKEYYEKDLSFVKGFIIGFEKELK